MAKSGYHLTYRNYANICFSPHSPQNLASFGILPPQLVQKRAVATAAPQLMQNLLFGGNALLHFTHDAVPPAIVGPPVFCGAVGAPPPP